MQEKNNTINVNGINMTIMDKREVFFAQIAMFNQYKKQWQESKEKHNQYRNLFDSCEESILWNYSIYPEFNKIEKVFFPPKLLGVTFYLNKDKYEGSFKHGKYNGFGVFNFDIFSSYKGYFKDGKKDGFGILSTFNIEYTDQLDILSTLESYDKYEGAFKDGEYNGFGVLTLLNDKYKYHGNFKDGKKDGLGMIAFTDDLQLLVTCKNDCIVKFDNEYYNDLLLKHVGGKKSISDVAPIIVKILESNKETIGDISEESDSILKDSSIEADNLKNNHAEASNKLETNNKVETLLQKGRSSPSHQEK